MDLLISLSIVISQTFIGILPYILVSAIAFPLLSSRFACNEMTPLWRRPGLITDICYWFVVPVFTRLMRIGLIATGGVILFGLSTADEIVLFFDNGHGYLATLPFWVQLILYLLVSDFLLYWSHRIFHRANLWRYHAVHHSSEDLDWISAARFHPVNLVFGSVLVDVALILAGIAPAVVGILVPFNILMSTFVHANLNWTFGPLKYVIATPVYHRWHHTAADRGGSKNFAATFPFIDLMFGTFYMPKTGQPDQYGVADKDFPKSFGEQLVYPFK